MSRPGLVIGLGGTGQWVLTWLKRDLLLSNNGQMPSNVRLLAVDTATQLEAGTSRVTASGSKEEGAEIGGVSLDKSEFIYVGGDSRPLAERVKAGRLPQIGQWYHAQRWLDSQAPAAFILDDGAGRIRQFGRMAVFKDILGQETKSQLWQAFQSAIDAVSTATDEQRRLEVMVVGSFAGGTGSGMFLDVALILRMLAQQKGIHHVLRGFFALPSVFTSAPSRNMKARTFAAWRELNRFMVINSDFPMPRIQYVENNRNFRIEPDQRIFDACYLVDGSRAGQPLADEAKFGAFPMMSEVVSAILDDEAGTAYTQWIFTNLAPEYAKRPDMPMYSALGAYTVQVPAHFVQEISSHELSQNILLQLLSPRTQPDEYEHLVASGAERHMALAAPDRNQEDRGFAGRSRSRRHFNQPISYEGKTAKPTLFFGRIANLNDAVAAGNVSNVVQRLVKAGDRLASSDGWAPYYPDIGDDPMFQKERERINQLIKYKTSQFARRDGESAEEVRARFRRIPEEVRRLFGGTVGTGDSVDEFYGEFGDALAEVQRVQMIIWRQMTQLNLLSILMGQSDDAIVARSGKLGYAWDFYDGVVQELNEFLSLMNQVNIKRNEDKPEVKLAGMVNKADGMMQAMLGKKFLLLWEHPDVKKSEEQYLRMQQRIINLRREQVLHRYVVETARMMKEASQEARDTIQTWIWHLSTGDDASGLPGMWDDIRRGKQNVVNAHSYDTQIDKVQELLRDKPIEADSADLAESLSRWEWHAKYKGEPSKGDPIRLEMTAEILPVSENADSEILNDPTAARSNELRHQIATQNQNKVINLARRTFSGVVARTTLAQALKESYPDPGTFVQQIGDVAAEPLFMGDPEASPLKKSNLIRVKSEENDDYFIGDDGIQGELRNRHRLSRSIINDNYGIQVVGSENPYKLTLVRTDDLYNYYYYASWQDCMDAYGEHMDGDVEIVMDPILLHNFPAESQAVIYERRLTKEPYNIDYRPLHPRVVMLLEDPEAFRQFLYLGMLGKISEERSPGEYRWELTWEKTRGEQTIWLTRAWNEDRDRQRPKPDVFNAMHGYIIRRETYQPNRRDSIDIEFATRYIRKLLEEIGPQGELDLLKDNLNGGFVGWLNEQAYNEDISDRVEREDFRDLALVSKMILEERIQRLEDPLAEQGIFARGQARKRDSNPFKTRQSASVEESADEEE